jgi:hypothetical protein
MEWVTEPKQDGYYWYVDVDFEEPIIVKVEEDGEVIILEDTPYEFEELGQDAPHFYGPFDLAPPEVPVEVLNTLHEAEAARIY